MQCYLSHHLYIIQDLYPVFRDSELEISIDVTGANDIMPDGVRTIKKAGYVIPRL